MYLITFVLRRNGRHPTILAYFSDDASKKGSPPDKKTSVDKKDKQEKATDQEVKSKRLNELLAKMSTDMDFNIVKEVIKPRSAAEKKERQRAADEKKKQKAANIAEAAKEVAETLGGDTKKTESELLSILLKGANAKGEEQLK